VIVHSSSNDPWILRSQPAAGRRPRLRLFCLPYAGGGAATYRLWADELPSDFEVCPVHLPGREKRFGEPLLTDAVEAAAVLTAVLAPYLDVPYAIFGHSMGAALAYEIALALVRTRRAPPTCLIVSARRAPHLPARAAPVHDLPDHLLIEELKRLNGTPRQVLEDDELMSFMLPMVRSDFRLAETYRAPAPIALPSPVIAIGGREDDDIPLSDLEAWRSVSNGEFRFHIVDGDHFFINSQRPSVIRIVAAELLRALDPD
jgi:medium-chain acyl-[acyl-carrier-protein] hydrolase